MPFPNPDTQFKPGHSGNPSGTKPGTKHLATHIQDMMNDEDFAQFLEDNKYGYVEFKGAPVKAIIITALKKAVAGDDKAREWLAKYGWGNKVQLSNDPDNPVGGVDDRAIDERLRKLIDERQAGSDNSLGSGATATG